VPEAIESEAPANCPECHTALAPGLLSCPGCQRLVHAETLKALAAKAENAVRDGDLTAALTCWRRALELLPPDSRQHAAVTAQVAELSRRLDAGAAADSKADKQPLRRKGPWSIFLGLGAALAFLLAKVKWLMLGLSKAGTLWTMLLSFGVYWTAWGWQFALGLVLSIYVHEMGHVAALHRYGIPATAPMFIPGFGALVRLKQNPATPDEDATVGLAGPLWGLGAACATYALFLLTGNPFFAALTDVGAFINLFNLMPLGPLDGGRGFRALARPQRWLVFLVLLAAWLVTSHGLLIVLGLFALLRALAPGAPEKPNHGAMLKYVFLVVALLVLAALAAPNAVQNPGSPRSPQSSGAATND